MTLESGGLAVVLVALSVVSLSPAAAQSQRGFGVARFEPADRGSPYFVVDPLDLRGRLRPAVGATFDYAYKPLAVFDPTGSERFALVRHQLVVHLGGSVVLASRLRLAVDLPVAAYQDGEAGVVEGETLSAATAPALGDLRGAVDVRLLGEHGQPFTFAVGARVWAPTGLRSQFTGDGSARLSPQLLAGGALGAFEWAARLAVVYRARDDAYAGSPLGSELFAAAGAGVHAGGLRIGPEVFASTVVARSNAFLERRTTPADWIFGVHYDVTATLRIGAGMGTGLTRGYGSPAFRGLASIEWSAAPAPPPPDRDRDGIVDAVDACPDEAGVPDSEPELNGCPPPPPIPREDADGDGISDLDDACPTIPGVSTPDARTNGCPPSVVPRQLAVVTDTEIRIEEQIRFATDSAELLPESDAVLFAVTRTLREHPGIRKLRVEGHTDETGEPTYNDELSARRAAAVMAWLVKHGVDARLLVSQGFGSRRPIDASGTDEGRARNRRVAFTILERQPPTAPTP